MRKLVLALGVSLLALPAFSRSAQAHFNLTMPPSIAKSTEGGKGAAPCGPDTATTGTITAVTGGSQLVLNIDETTPHPGFYRFALSMTSPPMFPADNEVKDSGGMVLTPTSNGLSASAAFEDPAKFPVLADHLFVHTDNKVQSFPSGTYPGTVTVPNLNCEKCTLQVIEFMANHGSNGPSAGFFYHHCSFLKITADPNKPIFDPNASGGAGGASSGGASGAGGVSGTGGASGGAAGSSLGGNGGGSGTVGVSGGGAGGATAAGAPSAGASVGGASAAGAASIPADPGDGGGCSMSHRETGAVPLLSALIGLFALRSRRRRRG